MKRFGSMRKPCVNRMLKSCCGWRRCKNVGVTGADPQYLHFRTTEEDSEVGAGDKDWEKMKKGEKGIKHHLQGYEYLCIPRDNFKACRDD